MNVCSIQARGEDNMTYKQADRRLKYPGDWAKSQAAFSWDVPEAFNIAEACVSRHAVATPNATALIHIHEDGSQEIWSYAQLEEASNRMANVFRAQGVQQGDRVAIILSQCPEALISHFAAYKLGAVALPLFALFGPDALEYRLSDSGARVAVTSAETLEHLEAIEGELPELQAVFCVDETDFDVLDFQEELEAAEVVFNPVVTSADDPACLIYTSGTTGSPKGALHAHRFLIGHLPSVEMYYDFFPHEGDICWTPADWAWIGALMDLAMPALYFGLPLVSHRMRKFTPAGTYDLIRATGANVMFLPPTALKMMRKEDVPAGLGVRVISSGGESLGADLISWAKNVFGADVNEMYGQTECNLVAGSIRSAGITREGWIGTAVPGHELAIISEDGAPVADGEVGEICVKAPDPVMMLRYWNKPEETAEKFRDGWLRTGDLGVMDGEWIRFASRSDDVISSAGYRIGPSEIEDCLTGHADVIMAAVIGVPDEIRGQAVKAFVVLREGAEWDGLERALIDRVKSHVSPHVAPKMIERRDSLPMTATGKILRRALRED